MNTLIQSATDLLEKRYLPPVHSVAAALRTANGEIITAVNIDHFLGFVCAETAALTIAINAGVYNFDEIVAVRKNESNETVIANMCGKCRQVFNDYAPGVNVHTSNGIRTIDELLPSQFSRQREKIELVLGKK